MQTRWRLDLTQKETLMTPSPPELGRPLRDSCSGLDERDDRP